MEASTTIRKMIQSAESIIVPSYQRAYSWESPSAHSKRQTHTDVFLADLEEYTKSQAKEYSSYYFGHFLFEKKDNKLFIVDGQQRLTTIVIFLSALFVRLKGLKELSNQQLDYYEDIILKRDTVRFQTVDYDNKLFQDFIIYRRKKDEYGLETESAKRMVKAFNYFTKILENKDSQYLSDLLNVIVNASCTTHTVVHESEAIQMFIFQNNRGKKPSKLELIKAQFMHHLHLYGGMEGSIKIKEVSSRFETIYKSISAIGYKIDEDDVLAYTLHIYKNTLSEVNTSDFINKQLSNKDGVSFVIAFSQGLATSFEHLKLFFNQHENESIYIHSLVTLGGISVALPFILKAYRLGLNIQEIGELCQSLESLVLRDKLIGTKADLSTRLNTVFVKFSEENPSIQPIIDHINTMKKTKDWWWAYWSNQALENSLQGWINPSVARFLLWKYENYLKNPLISRDIRVFLILKLLKVLN